VRQYGDALARFKEFPLRSFEFPSLFRSEQHHGEKWAFDVFVIVDDE
jgi:hypothetical protein